MSLGLTKRGVDVAAGYNPDGSAREPAPADFQRLFTEYESLFLQLAAGELDVDIPHGVIYATNSNSGDPNAITATTDYAIPDEDGGALIVLFAVAENTDTPVTISFNGGTPLEIKTSATGADPVVGGITAGMPLVGIIVEGVYRLLSEQASAAIQAAAEAAQAAAEAARDVATGAMSAVVLAENTFATKATAEAFSPEGAPDYIRTAGYSTAGDGGGGLYKKVASEPSHVAKFSITLSDGVTEAWYELTEIMPDPRQCGAVGGIFDDQIDAINAAFETSISGLISVSEVYAVSDSITLASGQGIVGTSKETSGFVTTTADAAWGMNTGVIVVEGAGCSVKNLSLDGRLASPEVWNPDRMSGIVTLVGSRDAQIENVDSSNFTRHGFLILGTGHKMRDISGDNCVADVLAFGAYELGTPGVWDVHAKGLALGTSHQRSAFEFNDGCHNITVEDFVLEGTWADGYGAMAVGDHNHATDANDRITIKNGKVTFTSTTRGSYLLSVTGSYEHTNILMEDVAAEGASQLLYCYGQTENVSLVRVKGDGLAQAWIFNSGLGPIETHRGVLLEDCVAVIDPTAWPGDVSDGFVFAGVHDGTIKGGKISHSCRHGGAVNEACENLRFDGLEIYNPNAGGAAATGRGLRLQGTTPSKTVFVNRLNIHSDDGNLAHAVEVTGEWRDAIVTENRFAGYTGLPVTFGSESGANKINTNNVEVPAA